VDSNLFTTRAALEAAQARGTDMASVAADPAFAAPLAGDYTVTNAAAAARAGFVNFAMDDFGVRPARLKALAATPAFPAPAGAADLPAADAPRVVAGMTVKRVQTAGEQSAAGLGRIAGVLVLAVEPDSRAAAAGYRPRDVIVAAFDGTALDDVAALQAFLDNGPAGSRDLVVVRNQARMRLPAPSR
jgi:S1-C subfamily serine protease